MKSATDAIINIQPNNANGLVTRAGYLLPAAPVNWYRVWTAPYIRGGWWAVISRPSGRKNVRIHGNATRSWGHEAWYNPPPWVPLREFLSATQWRSPFEKMNKITAMARSWSMKNWDTYNVYFSKRFCDGNVFFSYIVGLWRRGLVLFAQSRCS